MLISEECLEISNDAIGDIGEVGVRIAFRVAKNPVDTGGDAATSMKDKYAEFYQQTRNSDPEFEETEYHVNVVPVYSPATDKLESSGLNESCHIMFTLATYEFVKNGFATIDDELHTLIERLKRGLLVSFDGKLFVSKEVGMTATYEGFSIICNLGCDLYA